MYSFSRSVPTCNLKLRLGLKMTNFALEKNSDHILGNNSIFYKILGML